MEVVWILVERKENRARDETGRRSFRKERGHADSMKIYGWVKIRVADPCGMKEKILGRPPERRAMICAFFFRYVNTRRKPALCLRDLAARNVPPIRVAGVGRNDPLTKRLS